jgi:hypothetical protein
MHTNLQFTADVETDNSINYLDVSIHKSPTGLKISIFRKPTFTDTIIPYTSNHPTQHKYAAVKFLYHRLNNYNLQKQEHERELNINHNILYNNGFPIKDQNSLTRNTGTEHPHTTQRKWATFTYTGKETTYITNIFKLTDIKIAFRTNSTLDRLLSTKKPTTDKYTASGIYKLTCQECNKAYVGQTGRSFHIRYKEHKQAFKNNSHTSNYAKHLLDHAHPFGTIQNTMQILEFHRKGAHLNTLERFHIHAEHKINNHLNDEHTIVPNAIFYTLWKNHQT